MSDRALAVNAAWNYSRTIIDSVISLLLFTYIARTIPPSELGLMWLALSLSELFLLFDIGLLGVLPPGYLRERARERGAPAQLAGSAVMAAGGLGVLAGLATLTVGFAVVHLKAGSLQGHLLTIAPMVVVWTALYLAVFLPSETMSRVYEAEMRFPLLSSVQLLLGVVRGILTIALVHYGFGAIGVLAALAISTLLRLFVLASAVSVRRAGIPGFSFKWDWPRLRSAWHQGGWSLLSSIGHQISLGTDTLILFLFTSPRQVALYGVGRRFPLYVIVAIQKALAVTLPSMVREHVADDLDELRRLFITTLRTAVAVVLPFLLIGSVVATPLLGFWVGPKFSGADATLRWLLLATLAVAIATACNTVLYAIGEISTDARYALSQVAINLALTVVLVIPYGAAGAASATGIASITVAVVGLLPATCSKLDVSPVEVVRDVVRGIGLPVIGMMVVLLLTSAVPDMGGNAARLSGGALAGLTYAALFLRGHRADRVTG